MNLISAVLVIAAGAALFWIDLTFFESGGVGFMGKTLFDIIEWLAFWR